MKSNYVTRLKRQRGIALIASLIILLLMTIVAISMMRGNSLFEKIAGNTREKQRALQSAQDALLHAEWWVQQTTSVTTPVASCPTTGKLATLQVCPTSQDPGTNVSTLNTLPYFSWTPDNMSVNASGTVGGIVSSGAEANDVMYSSSPGIYITALPPINGTNPLYRITAIGFGGSGGSSGAVAIVQSIFMVGGNSSQLPPTKNVGG